MTAVKPNRSEAFLAAGVPWSDPIDPAMDDAALLEAGAKLLANVGHADAADHA